MEINIKNEGVKLVFGEMVKEFKLINGKDVLFVVIDKGEYVVDLVIMSVGFRLRIEMVDVEKLFNGVIKVNNF